MNSLNLSCRSLVQSRHTLLLILTSLSRALSNPFSHRCTKHNLFELIDYNRSKILICTHGCECAWCRDCSRKVNIESPHDCKDAALEVLAGERRWMRCPRPSTSPSCIVIHLYFLPYTGPSSLQNYGGKECRVRSYHLPVWNVSQSIKA